MSTQYFRRTDTGAPGELVAVRFCAAEGTALRFTKRVSANELFVDEQGQQCTLAGVVNASLFADEGDPMMSALRIVEELQDTLKTGMVKKGTNPLIQAITVIRLLSALVAEKYNPKDRGLLQ